MMNIQSTAELRERLAGKVAEPADLAVPEFLQRTKGRTMHLLAWADEPIKFHPVAERFRQMGGEEFDALVEDIKANGVREPLVLLGDMILDGRNRYRAAVVAERDFEAWDFDPEVDGDPLAYVISA